MLASETMFDCWLRHFTAPTEYVSVRHGSAEHVLILAGLTVVHAASGAAVAGDGVTLVFCVCIVAGETQKVNSEQANEIGGLLMDGATLKT